MANNVITDIESKNKATSNLNFSSLIFVISYMFIAFMFQGYVNLILQIPYYIFSLICAVFLVLPSRFNKGRNNLESIYVMLNKDIAVYRPYVLVGKEEDERE